jgi:hypothetical protein
MTAARNPTPPPDMSGLGDDWKRYEDLRRGSDTPATSDDTPSRDATTSRRREPTTPRRRDATAKPRRAAAARERRRPAPQAAGSVPTTVRFDPEESAEIDMWVVGLRRETGRRIDKAEAVRELLRMARIPGSPTRKTLIKRLRND